MKSKNTVKNEISATKVSRINLEDAVATAQWLQTRHEWEKHIDFLRRWIGKKVTRKELDFSIDWYERIYGKYKTK